MLLDIAEFLYDAGSNGADLLTEELCGHIALGLTHVVVDAAAQALPAIGSGMLASLQKIAIPDLVSSALGVQEIHEAVQKAMTHMGVDVVGSKELGALRTLANAVAGQGDVVSALAALVSVKAANGVPTLNPDHSS